MADELADELLQKYRHAHKNDKGAIQPELNPDVCAEKPNQLERNWLLQEARIVKPNRQVAAWQRI
jgi:hypothetical protein